MSDRLPSFVEPLPAHPNVEMQQKRARALLRAIHGGEAVALARLTALHPHPPAAGDATLADAQLVVARGYGFPSWAAMKRKIESLVKPPIEQFAAALRDGDIERVRALLAAHAEVRAAINSPIGPFGSRPAAMVKTNLPLLDVLLAHGADLNRKSDWWAGGFGLLEYDCTPEQAVPLIARGAVVDVWAAAHLGMHDRVRELLDADPSLVQARGGDGKTPLHCARTVDVARELVERGADLDTRDVDHESTPAQHLVREAPEVAPSSSIAARGTTSTWPSACGIARASNRPCVTIRARSITAPGTASTSSRITDRGRPRPRKGTACAAISTAGRSVTTSRRSTSPTWSVTRRSCSYFWRRRLRRNGSSRRPREATGAGHSRSSPRILTSWHGSRPTSCGCCRRKPTRTTRRQSAC